jgi:hypothetical protein
MAKQFSIRALRKKPLEQHEALEGQAQMRILIENLKEIRDYHHGLSHDEGNQRYYDTLSYLVSYFNEIEDLDEKVVLYLTNSLEQDYGINDCSTIKSWEELEQEPMWSAFRDIILKSHLISSEEALFKYIGNYKKQMVEVFFNGDSRQAIQHIEWLDEQCEQHCDNLEEDSPELALYYSNARKFLKQ